MVSLFIVMFYWPLIFWPLFPSIITFYSFSLYFWLSKIINEVIQYFFFCVWLILFSTVLSRFFHVWQMVKLPFWRLNHVSPYRCINYPLSVDGYLDCFYILSTMIMLHWALRIQRSFWGNFIFSGHIHRGRGITESLPTCFQWILPVAPSSIDTWSLHTLFCFSYTWRSNEKTVCDYAHSKRLKIENNNKIENHIRNTNVVCLFWKSQNKCLYIWIVVSMCDWKYGK